MPIDASLSSSTLRQWEIDLSEKAREIVPEVRELTDEYGRDLTVTARDYIRRRAYDTGSLHRSVNYLIRKQRSSVTLRFGSLENTIRKRGLITRRGGDKDAPSYSGYVHDGTTRMRPRPFVTVALRKHQKAYLKDLADLGANI